ncbi:MAG: signal peptidase II [Desulfotomaculaceae bacterium]|nr:signal peptidase II [Desulfotomaculaceae bacterium]MDD4766396.1 signal peptidase II [Desulfotomaculaceae bacterium]
MFLSIIMAVLLADQGAKAAVRLLMYQGESIPVLPSVFHLTYIMNPGAAFGILPNQNVLFIITAVLLIIGALAGYRKLPAGRNILRIGLALVLGGALGNLLDRLRFGKVVDFLDFRIWPVFNLADTAIFIGVCLLAWELLKDSGKSDKGCER